MIQTSKHFQEGQLSYTKNPYCSFGTRNHELSKQLPDFLKHLKKGLKIFTLMQNNPHNAYNLECYKNNPYLKDIYVDKSSYLEFLRAIIHNNSKIQELYCDHNMFLGNLQISRASKPQYIVDVQKFLLEKIVPTLKKLKIRRVLAAHNYQFAYENESEENYQRGFEKYLRCVVAENQDLHFFIQYIFDILDKMTDGDFHCNSTFFNKDVPLLELEPFINTTALGVSYFYYKLRNENKNSKSNLPRLTFLNLDGYDHGLVNFNSLEESQKNISYISLFCDNIITHSHQNNNNNSMEIEEITNKNQERNKNNEEDEHESEFEQLIENQVPNCVKNGKTRISCEDYDGDYKSVLDTFDIVIDKDQKQKDQNWKHCFLYPLQSQILDHITNQESQNIPITSGKIRTIFREVIYPLIRNFQPEVIIVSTSLALNKFSHSPQNDMKPFNNISLNPQLFSEIMSHLQTYSNSKIIYCSHLLKSYTQKEHIEIEKPPDEQGKNQANEMKSFSFKQPSQTMRMNATAPSGVVLAAASSSLSQAVLSSSSSEKGISFDEKYFNHVMDSFSFSSTDQIDSLYPYLRNIFSSFMQVSLGQWAQSAPKNYYHNSPQKTLTKLEFSKRMSKYMRYLANNYNQNLKQYIPSHSINEDYLDIMNGILEHYKEQMQHDNLKSQYRQTIQSNYINKFTKDQLKLLLPHNENQMQVEEDQEQNKIISNQYFIKSNPYIYNSIHIVSISNIIQFHLLNLFNPSQNVSQRINSNSNQNNKKSHSGFIFFPFFHYKLQRYKMKKIFEQLI